MDLSEDFKVMQQHLQYRGWLSRADKMNTVLLITIMFTLASVHGFNPSPCQRNPDNNAYNKFVRKHILQEDFNKQSKTEWRRYLTKYRLCDRRRQSFFSEEDQPSVVQICNGYGRPLYHSYQGNLCISDSRMLIYYVEVSNRGDCRIEKLKKRTTYVIVACDRVQNRCRPVHFEPYKNQRPDTQARHCRPRAKNRQSFWS